MFDIYKNKKVFITGHTGFKGSWLSIWLNKIGSKVIGYALDPKTNKDNFILTGLSKKITDYRGDIRNFNNLFKIVNKEKPEIIFHLAAQPLVIDSYKEPLYTIETNTLGTANILEVFRKIDSVKVMIIITTDKVYHNNEREWGYRECDRLGGNDIYSASKAAAEILISSYQKSFFNNSDKKLASVRAGNVIGGGDWSDYRIVPDCIKALENNEKIRIRNPESTRPWQHVLEPLAGYLMLGERILESNNNDFSEAWNFGPYHTNNVSVENLVKKIICSYGRGEYSISNNFPQINESKILFLDISKAVRRLKWKPVLTFDETIDMTIDWYKQYKSVDVYKYCIEQIKEYERLWRLRSEN